MTSWEFVFAMSSGVDWLICGCVGVLLTTAITFRVTTRAFDWGPRDT